MACTYYGHRSKLTTIGREDELKALNRNSIQMAREAAGALVAGNLSNTCLLYTSDAADERVRV